MPQVENAIHRRFPDAKIKLYDPDQSVAKGAAVFCRSSNILKSIEEKITEETQEGDAPADESVISEKVDEAAMDVEDTIIVHNVLSKSFGIKVGDGNGNEYVSNIVYRNIPLPIVENKTYYPNVDGQLSIDVEIYENAAQNDDNGLRVELADSNLVGSFSMKLPEDVTAKTPIQVRFTVSNDGMLSAYVECNDQHTDYTLKTKTSMSEEEIKKYRGLIERSLE